MPTFRLPLTGFFENTRGRPNEEYSALLREIDGMNDRISELEEGILLSMEAIDGAKSRLESVEKEQEIVERGHRSAAKGLHRELARVEEDLARRGGEREERLQLLGSEVVALYRRVTKAHGSGVAILRDGRCSGCHRAIPPQTMNLVAAGELHTCSNCQRILVPGEP